MNKKTKQPVRQAYQPGANQPLSGSTGGGLASWFPKHLSRRTVGKGLAWSAVLGMAGISIYELSGADEPEVSLDTLELQKKEGWNIGSTDKPLSFNGSTNTDSRQQTWSAYDPNYLISIYQPRDSAWQPFFTPTLIQSLSQPSLNAQMRPTRTPQMQDSYERAQGLRELLSQAENAGKTLIISDLPGPQSIALGAALADTATLVPSFDNWPHPLGVVPAHETLGALTYYAREIEEKKAKLKDNAPALLLLDGNRLTPYADEDTQFDNRYLAKLPPADQLKQRGVENILYVVKDETQKSELDDINEDFVEWQKNGVNVKMMPLSEFKPYDEPVTAATTTGQTTQTVRHYYYGGSPLWHGWFYSHYYYQPYPTAGYYSGGRSYSYAQRSTPPPFSPPAYRPVSRPTMFSAARVGGTSSLGVGKTRPSGFGRTSVRMSGQRVTGIRAGRSGSYGRGLGGWFSG